MKSKSALWGIVLIAAGVALLIAYAVLGGLGVWDSDDGVPGGTDGITGTIERHFLEQMIPHHEDAVAMSELALARAQHPELKQLAETIIRDQTREIDQMRTWYESWYGAAAPVGVGEFRGPGGSGMMGGGMMMNDAADLQVLEAATEFDREFIEQMIPHHQMGVMMARMVLARSDRTEIQDLARSIIRTQTAEIQQMRDWYAEWYGR